MELHFDNQLISVIQISPEHTLGQLKRTINEWLIPQGVINYNIKVLFSDGSELSPIVFNSDDYDNTNFQAQKDILNGKIFITTPTNIVEIKGDPYHRRKIQTKQIKTDAIPKGKKVSGRKITGKEKEYMLAKRLQKFTAPEEARTIYVPTPPSRLQPISEEELIRRQVNLQDAPVDQNMAIIPDNILELCLPKLALRDYQIRAIKHMLKNRGLIAVHNIGSGKTLIAATSAMCILKANPIIKIIFISPKSLIENFRKTLNESYDNVDWNRFLFYTYEKFQLDYNKGLIDSYNTYLIVDEAHRLRTHVNPKSGILALTVKAVVKAARKASKVLLLTATPIVNEPYDIVNLITIIKGDLTPISKKAFHSNIYSKKGSIMNTVSFNDYFNCIISIYKRPLDETYPQVEIHTVEIPMTKQYYNEYKRVENQILTPLETEILGENDLEPFYNGIRRAVNADIEEFNPKLDWVRQHLLKYNNRKMIMFSPFISLGVRQLERLVVDFDVKPKFGIITGDNTKEERQKVIDDYNNDKIQILVISIGAGGLGINLKGTRDVVIMQPGWNDVEMEQAMGRGIRFHSHTHLPVDERKVDVWKLLLVKPPGVNGKLAADQIIENITQRKNNIIKPFLNILNYISIENMPC